MQDHELDAYLGGFADRLDDDRKANLGKVLDEISDRWSGPDFTDDRTEAGNAATELAFGDATADRIARKYQTARIAEHRAYLRLTAAIKWVAVTEKLSEPALAERFGVTRMTIRKALGK